MNKIIIAILFCFMSLLAQNTENLAESNEDFSEQSRLVYLKQSSNFEAQNNYVGETISVKYNITILENAQIDAINILEARDSSISVKNKDSAWNEADDGSLENTFYYKINATDFTIPTIEVVVSKGDYEERATSEAFSSKAIVLSSNDKYSGVVGSSLELQDYSIKEFDATHNIVLMQLVAQDSNLEDFKLQGIERQGFQTSNFSILKSSALYYIIVPKSLPSVNFEYFNLINEQYKAINIKNTINNKDTIAISEDLSPVNQALIFTNLIIGFVAFLFVILVFIKKIPFKIRILFILIALGLVAYIFINTSVKKEATLNPNARITILPLENSTMIEQSMRSLDVSILNSYGNYYKVLLNDNRTGWVKKSDVK